MQSLLRRKQFKVRCATRQKDSAKALALAAQGCEIVEASYDNYESLVQALTGAYGAWFITSFWDSGKGTVEAEVELGNNVARAAAQAGVKHLIYSTLESPAVMSGSEFPTFDAKIGVEQEILYAGVPFTFVQVAYYFNNFENNTPGAKHSAWYPWKKDENGAWIIEVPIGKNGLHGIHSEDVGECCGAIFEQPEKFLGRKVALSGELLTPESMLAGFQGAFPDQKFVFHNPDLDTYKKNLAPGFGDALWRMYKWYQFRMPRGGDIALTKGLNPAAHDFASYLKAHADRFKF